MHPIKVEFAHLIGRLLADRWHKTKGMENSEAHSRSGEKRTKKGVPGPRGSSPTTNI